MERPERRQERDVNELLANGFFRTSRARSPSPYSYRRRTPSPPAQNNYTSNFLSTFDRDGGRARSKSRVRHKGPPPPRPTVEDEAVSLARESSPSSFSSYDPPSRGVIDQYPIILESDVSEGDAERLHATPRPNEWKDCDENSERRFVLVPETDTSSNDESTSQSRGENEQTTGRSERGRPKSKFAANTEEDETNKFGDEPMLKPSPLERRRSRQDLPNIQTKSPREIPSQYRRSASAYGSRDSDETPNTYAAPHTSTGEYFLSPDAVHSPRGQFKETIGSVAQPGPRYHPPQETSRRRGNSINEKRNSESSLPNNISRSGTPLASRKDGGNFEASSRSRRNSNDRTAHPQPTLEDLKRLERLRAGESERGSGSEPAYSPKRLATSNSKHYSSSEDDVVDSGSERGSGRRRHEHRRTKDLRKEDDYERRLDSPRSNRSPSHSKFSSPLPSPKISSNQLPRTEPFERAETFPQGRRPSSRPGSPLYSSKEISHADRLNQLSPGSVLRPSSRQSNSSGPIPIPQMQQIPAPFPHHGLLPISIPTRIDFQSPFETERTPTVPQYEDERPPSTRPPSTRPVPNDKPYWQPPPFQPPQFPSDNLQRPVGSYRRYSEDVGRGGVAPLPSCPRMDPTIGYQDWLTLPQCPNFDICPSCFNSIIAPTTFRDHFILAPRRPDISIICDFGSSPWYRIAWLLTIKDRRNDLGLFYSLANVGAIEAPCLGKREAFNRSWNSIIDPKTGSPIKDFDVCNSCVKSIEALLPPIRGVFIRTIETEYSSSIPRICDLRSGSKRFVQYFDVLETTADDAAYHNSSPDTRALAKLARKFSVLAECQQFTDLFDRRWYIITQLPEFTVCEECFDDVVLPELEDRKSIPLTFNKIPQRIEKASCQLYSPRMRAIFQKACDSTDYMLLATKVRERKGAELAWKVNVAATKRQSRESMVPNPLMGREIQRLNDEWRKWE
ncbi:65e96e8b-a6b1-4754-a360-cecf0cb858e3 [Sclerotinia trifoliorum]|uniref:65e96e8b-a6b1-4754-a360-cecf0cb858e3 n=1 Tax=Sclerotinia trifoliorum TaxID=28548 RepID=A0A8H2ZKQ4_9HELO|nr:65e96e8b-a6b1-4754-a360-cecf0cb858e3 [Sclerotinia trifoliorum]